jgi:uncharacterized protein YjeT (DUF2065 family)
MNKALKVVMIIFGLVLVLEGLLDIAIPGQRASAIGPGGSSVMFFMTILGATWVAAGFWVVAAGRNPARHINWVKFAITLPVLLSIVLVFSIVRGYVGLDQVAIDLVLDAAFALTFLALYPWRLSTGEKNTSAHATAAVEIK